MVGYCRVCRGGRPQGCHVRSVAAHPPGELSQYHAVAAADMARFCSYFGAFAAAWVTAGPGPVTGLYDITFSANARLRHIEDLLLSRNSECCLCGCSDAAGIHSLVRSAKWKVAVYSHHTSFQSWRCILGRMNISSSAEPHVRRLVLGLGSSTLPAHAAAAAPMSACSASLTLA